MSRFRPQYNDKGKVTKTVEQMRKEFDRELLGSTRIQGDGRPSWYTSDDDAVNASMAAARALGIKTPALGT